MQNNISGLIDWYLSQCDGDWEHQHGFKLTTLDNPGLWLSIDLNGTNLKGVDFQAIVCDIDSEDRWCCCKKTEKNFFEGCCHPSMFAKVIEVFEGWVRENK